MSYEVSEIVPNEKEKICERCGGVPVVTGGLCRFCFEEENPEFYKNEEVAKHKLIQHGKGTSENPEIETKRSIRKILNVLSKKRKMGGNEFSST